MSPYNIARFQPLVEDGQHFNVFDAAYSGMRFAIPVVKQLVVTSADAANLPGLANQYLGSVGLWWALLMFNGLSDPLNDVKPGIVLNIPDKTSLLSYLNRPTLDSGSLVPSLENSIIL